MWIAMHSCVEATLGISPYSYLYLKLAKHYLSYFLFNKIENKKAEQVLPRNGLRREVAQKYIYT
jgi:hypothetical protein